MNIDLTLIPTTFDSIHAALAAIVVGLFVLQILFLLVVLVAFGRKPKPAMPEAKPETRAEAETPQPTKVETRVIKEATPDAAIQLLGMLQKEARFIDFIQEDIGNYSDADIGAAARVVHEGCRKVLKQHFELEPVRGESEGSRITLPKGFDAQAVRLTGNIVGEAPFTGTLVHRGWKVKAVKLPHITEGHDVRIVATAEVEL